MVVLVICLATFYLISLALCALFANPLFGGREAKIVTTLAFVPIVNLVLAVVVVMLLRTLYKETKSASSQNTEKKEKSKK